LRKKEEEGSPNNIHNEILILLGLIQYLYSVDRMNKREGEWLLILVPSSLLFRNELRMHPMKVKEAHPHQQEPRTA